MLDFNSLTRDERKVLDRLWERFTINRRSMLPNKANRFSDSVFVAKMIYSNPGADEIDFISSLCWGLNRKGFIVCYKGDNLANEIQLTSDAIALYESKPKKLISNTIDLISKFKP